MGKGSFNNYVDKKRGMEGQFKIYGVSHDKGYIACKMSIFVYLRGVGVNFGPHSS